jgi:epoxide hydrolase-like predicted phosphatase
MVAEEKSTGKIRAVIFDFGGVLVRMIDDTPRLKLAEQLGVPLSQLDELVFFSESAQRASRGELTIRQHWEVVRLALGIQPEEMLQFLQQYWSADDVNYELLGYIRTLRPRYKVGLLSNAWNDLRQTLHTRWNIDGLFDELIISAEVGLVKPDPRIYHLALERLGVQAEEAVFIDDIAGNVDAARAEGLAAIQFHNTQQVLGELGHLLVADETAV